MVREPEAFLDKRLFISGGGDSALDWAIYFAEQSHLPVGLVHRSDMFTALKDSVEQVYKLQEKGKIELYTHAEIKDVNGDEILETIELHQKEKSPKTIAVDYWLPLFGLSPKLGPICNWGLEIEKNGQCDSSGATEAPKSYEYKVLMARRRQNLTISPEGAKTTQI